MHKKGWLLIISCLSILLLVGCSKNATQHSNKKVTQPVPTIFVHGLMGSHKSTDKMITAMQKNGQAKKIMTINVQADGKLKRIGKYDHQVKRPIIQVNFENNEASIQTQTKWLTETLHYLRVKQHVKRYNAVAHSAGNITLVETEMKATKTIPQLKRLVIIAGPFNGVIGMNDAANTNQLQKNYRPKIIYPANDWYPSYEQLLSWRHHFPANVRILNIYGDLGDGSHSDGMVTEQSELSVNYLLRGLHDSIKNVKITGQNAAHSSLHDNQTVNRQLIKFLWN
ncbi:alpha/beta hydrolase [Paucilactobacillus kaifaensis]|uniref:alpha/beta hydrolase n=1 Tax=Paucilactobacillus kaifaensis TaxID=2559921 RepID=UPI0010F57D23|nr:alpha/beta hydrolase [Paucilactobacillus kaifaensis]